MSNQIIPVTSNPNQTFTVTGTIDGANLTLTFKFSYSEMANYWVATVWDANLNLLIDSLAIVGNALGANLFPPYMKIGALYPINVSGDPSDYPTSTNLGTAWQILWGDTPTT